MLQIQDLDPDSNPGFESGFKINFRLDPDPKLLFRIRNIDGEFHVGFLMAKVVVYAGARTHTRAA